MWHPMAITTLRDRLMSVCMTLNTTDFAVFGLGYLQLGKSVIVTSGTEQAWCCFWIFKNGWLVSSVTYRAIVLGHLL